MHKAHSWKLCFISILCQHASYNNVYSPSAVTNIGISANVSARSRNAYIFPFFRVLRKHYFSSRAVREYFLQFSAYSRRLYISMVVIAKHSASFSSRKQRKKNTKKIMHLYCIIIYTKYLYKRRYIFCI